MRTEAIYNIYSQVVMQDDATGCFDQNGNSVTIDEAKVAEEIKRLKADYDSKKYQRDRLAEYPSIQECIHAILDDDLTALQAKRKLIKEKYPKP